MKKALIYIITFLAIISIGYGVKILFFVDTVINNTLDMPKDINNAVMDAENAIYNYEWFKQQEADIKRLVKQEESHNKAFNRFKESLPKDRSKWSLFDKDEYQKLSSNITAQEDMVNRAMQNYNAKSSMVTKNIFKDNLPSNLSRSWYAQRNLISQ